MLFHNANSLLHRMCVHVTPQDILKSSLQASNVKVTDTSGGCGSMYDIAVESPLFKVRNYTTVLAFILVLLMFLFLHLCVCRSDIG